MTMKPIEWHENCLNNMLIFQKNQEEYLERLHTELVKAKEKLDFYEDQIKSAKIMGKKEFDSDVFKKHLRNSKNSELSVGSNPAEKDKENSGQA